VKTRMPVVPDPSLNLLILENNFSRIANFLSPARGEGD